MSFCGDLARFRFDQNAPMSNDDIESLVQMALQLFCDIDVEFTTLETNNNYTS